MAQDTVITCDFTNTRGRRCGQVATLVAAAQVGATNFRMDVCAEHQPVVEKALAKLGMQATVQTHGHARRTYIAKSGRPFTSRDARRWLVERGRAGEHGRLSSAQIQEYADVH